MAETDRTDTIEWGATVAERQGWLGRLTATPPRDEAPAPRRRRLRVNYLALGFAVVGFLGVLASQYLPWMHLDFSSLDGASSLTQREYDLPVGGVSTWQNVAYGVSLPLVFATIAALLIAGDAIRLPLAAAGIGLLAGQLTLLVGMARAIQQGAGLASISELTAVPRDIASLGPGYTVAVAAAGLLIVAVLIAGRAPRPARVKDEPTDAAEEEEMDLVVTALPESAYRGDIHSDPASTHG
jgi:hypothetical protein